MDRLVRQHLEALRPFWLNISDVPSWQEGRPQKTGSGLSCFAVVNDRVFVVGFSH